MKVGEEENLVRSNQKEEEETAAPICSTCI